MGRAHETHGKKEIAKKKAQNRKDKDEKKQLRNANSAKGKGLEDMLAYVDENGNLTTTPPDPKKRKEIKSEDISLSASGNSENSRDDGEERTGTVVFFNTTKGFGFIKDSRSGDSFFIHANDLLEPIAENDKVSFDVASGKRGMHATDVKKIK